MTTAPAPWDYTALPPWLTPEHFRTAARAWISHREQITDRGDRIRPVTGAFGGRGTFTYGGGYPETDRRRDELRRLRPLTPTDEGDTAYVVILDVDQTTTDYQNPDRSPLALFAVTGFVGTVFGDTAASWEQPVERGKFELPPTYFTTVVLLGREDARTVVPRRIARAHD